MDKRRGGSVLMYARRTKKELQAALSGLSCRAVKEPATVAIASLARGTRLTLAVPIDLLSGPAKPDCGCPSFIAYRGTFM